MFNFNQNLTIVFLLFFTIGASANFCPNNPKPFDQNNDGVNDFTFYDCQYDVEPAEVIELQGCQGPVVLHKINCTVLQNATGNVFEGKTITMALEHDASTEGAAGYSTQCKFQAHDNSTPYGNTRCDPNQNTLVTSRRPLEEGPVFENFIAPNTGAVAGADVAN